MRPAARATFGVGAALAGIGFYASAYFTWQSHQLVLTAPAVGAGFVGAMLAWTPSTLGWRRAAARLVAVMLAVVAGWTVGFVTAPRAALDHLPLPMSLAIEQARWDWNYWRAERDAEEAVTTSEVHRFASDDPEEPTQLHAAAMRDRSEIRARFSTGCTPEVPSEARAAAYHDALDRWLQGRFGRDVMADAWRDYQAAHYDCMMREGRDAPLQCSEPGAFEGIDLSGHEGLWIRGADPEAAARWARWGARAAE